MSNPIVATQPKRLSLLFSYAYLRKDETLNSYVIGVSDESDVIIDSGGFSAINSGAEIDLGKYMKACHEYHGKVWQYVQLDLPRNKKVTEENLGIMVKDGLTPMPVLTTDMEYEKINDLIKIDSCYVCVAGGVSTPDKFIWQRYQKAFEASSGKAIIHGLGFLRHPDVYQLPIYSGDSSSIAASSQYGFIPFFDPVRELQSVSTKEVIKRGNIALPKDERLRFLCRAGLTKELIESKEFDRGTFSFGDCCSAYAYLKYMEHSYEYNFKMIVALSRSWIFLVLGVLDSKFRGGFNYPAAVSKAKTLQELFRTDLGECINQSRKVLKKFSPR